MKLGGTGHVVREGICYFGRVQIIGAGDVESFGEIDRCGQCLSLCQDDIATGVVKIDVGNARIWIDWGDMLVALRQGLDNALISVDGVFFCQ